MPDPGAWRDWAGRSRSVRRDLSARCRGMSKGFPRYDVFGESHGFPASRRRNVYRTRTCRCQKGSPIHNFGVPGAYLPQSVPELTPGNAGDATFPNYIFPGVNAAGALAARTERATPRCASKAIVWKRRGKRQPCRKVSTATSGRTDSRAHRHIDHVPTPRLTNIVVAPRAGVCASAARKFLRRPGASYRVARPGLRG